MKIQDVMATHPVCCTVDTSVPDVARLMVAHDCGALPVVENEWPQRPVGIVTDRDIVVRLVARDGNPRRSRVSDAMTDVAVTVKPDDDIDEARLRMQEYGLRRLMVVDESGTCVGLVSLADVAGCTSESEAGAVLKEISRPRTGPEKVSF